MALYSRQSCINREYAGGRIEPASRHGRDLVRWPAGRFCRGASRDEFSDLGEWAQAEPAAQVDFELPIPGDHKRALFLGLRDRGIAHPDLGQGAQVGRQVEIDFESWV